MCYGMEGGVVGAAAAGVGAAARVPKLRESIGHGAKRGRDLGRLDLACGLEDKDAVRVRGAGDGMRGPTPKDWGSERRVHDVLHRVRDLLYRVLMTRIAYVRDRELQPSRSWRAEVLRETLHEQAVGVVFSEVTGAREVCYVSELAAILGEVLASAEAGLRGAEDAVLKVFDGEGQAAISADVFLTVTVRLKCKKHVDGSMNSGRGRQKLCWDWGAYRRACRLLSRAD